MGVAALAHLLGVGVLVAVALVAALVGRHQEARSLAVHALVEVGGECALGAEGVAVLADVGLGHFVGVAGRAAGAVLLQVLLSRSRLALGALRRTRARALLAGGLTR